MSDKVSEYATNYLQHTGKGVCFAHGPYENADRSAGCPKWPACITDPQKSEYKAMGAAALPSEPAAPKGRCDLNVLLHPHRVGTCQNWKPFMSAEEIKPIGLKILNHPRLEEWLNTGQARQLHDGLWLHYAVVCTLLKEAYADARDKHIRMTSSRPPLPRGLE